MLFSKESHKIIVDWLNLYGFVMIVIYSVRIHPQLSACKGVVGQKLFADTEYHKGAVLKLRLLSLMLENILSVKGAHIMPLLFSFFNSNPSYRPPLKNPYFSGFLN